MLDALPAVLEAFCVAAVEEEFDSDSDTNIDSGSSDSNSDSNMESSSNSDNSSNSNTDSNQGEATWKFNDKNGDKEGGASLRRTKSQDFTAKAVKRGERHRGCSLLRTIAPAIVVKKVKGKGKPQSDGGGLVIARSRCSGGDGHLRTAAKRRLRRSAVVSDREGLPKQGQAFMSEVTDALLDRPWPPGLALPLLVMFGKIYVLVEMLEFRRGTETGQGACKNERGGRGRVGSRAGGFGLRAKENVWTRVRSRLMDCVSMGGLDEVDFTGIARQVGWIV